EQDEEEDALLPEWVGTLQQAGLFHPEVTLEAQKRVLDYISPTATLATFFVGQDADDDEAEIVGAKSIDALRDEITALRTEIQSLRREN
ncbi:MAG: hypothetical protein WCA35_32040, partial [Kovacikia sp.]